MGLSKPPPDPALQAQQMQLQQQLKTAQNQQDQTIQQSLGQTSLDWLKQFGQVQAVKSAGITTPFSTVSWGFAKPFLAGGTPLGGGAGR